MRRPNYRQERIERERKQAQKTAVKAAAKAERATKLRGEDAVLVDEAEKPTES